MLQRQAKVRSRAARLEALRQAEATGGLQPTQEHGKDQEAAQDEQQMTYDLQSVVDNESEAHFEHMDGPKDSPRPEMNRQRTRALLGHLKSSRLSRRISVLSDKTDSQSPSSRLGHMNRRIEAWIDRVQAARAPGSLYSYHEPEATHSLSQISYPSVPSQESEDRQTFSIDESAILFEADAAAQTSEHQTPPKAPRMRNLKTPSLSSTSSTRIWRPDDLPWLQIIGRRGLMLRYERHGVNLDFPPEFRRTALRSGVSVEVSSQFSLWSREWEGKD